MHKKFTKTEIPHLLITKDNGIKLIIKASFKDFITFKSLILLFLRILTMDQHQYKDKFQVIITLKFNLLQLQEF
jgi:Na+-transporting NADH:ubiquinone oxidoreductase subunit NqrE